MKYSKKERLDIGRKIYESGMSYLEAGATFGINDETARRYQIYYENNSGILHQHGTKILLRTLNPIIPLIPNLLALWVII